MRNSTRSIHALTLVVAGLMATSSIALAAPVTAPTVGIVGPSGDIPAGASIAWTVKTSLHGPLQYQFWSQFKSGVRRILQPYSSNARVIGTVAPGPSVLGVSVKSLDTSKPWVASRTIMGIQPTKTPRTTVIPVDAASRLGSKKLGRFWLANPVKQWITLGPYLNGPRAWVPRFPGRYQIVSMIKSPTGTVKATERTVTVVTRAHALVALGDSISFGWNLGNNWNPSPYAFPFLMGKAMHLPVDDLGYPGWTTANLLQALSSKTYMAALSTASVVTIDIGNNDLVQPAFKDGLLGQAPPSSISPSTMAGLESDVSLMGHNLGLILQDVHKEAPHARIIVYNLYDPLATSDTVVGQAASLLIDAADTLIAKAAANSHVALVNANLAFQGHQAVDVQPVNFHPTITGQEVLAKAGEAALASVK